MKIGLVEMSYMIQAILTTFSGTYMGILLSQNGFSAAAISGWVLALQIPILIKPLIGYIIDKIPKYQVLALRFILGITAILIFLFITQNLTAFSSGLMTMYVFIHLGIIIADTIVDLFVITNVKEKAINFSAWTNIANFIGGQISAAIFAFGIKTVTGNWQPYFLAVFFLVGIFGVFAFLYRAEQTPIVSPENSLPAQTSLVNLPANSVRYNLKNVFFVILFCILFATSALADIPYEMFMVKKFGDQSLTITASARFTYGLVAMGIYVIALIPRVTRIIKQYRMPILIGCGIFAVINWAALAYISFDLLLAFFILGIFAGILINLIFISILIDTAYARKPAACYQVYAFSYMITGMILRSVGLLLADAWGYAAIFWIIAAAYFLMIPIIVKIRFDPPQP